MADCPHCRRTPCQCARNLFCPEPRAEPPDGLDIARVAHALYRERPDWRFDYWSAHAEQREHITGRRGDWYLRLWREDDLWRGHVARFNDPECWPEFAIGLRQSASRVVSDAEDWVRNQTPDGAARSDGAALECADASRRDDARSGGGTGHRAEPPAAVAGEGGACDLQSVADRLNREVLLPGGRKRIVDMGAVAAHPPHYVQPNPAQEPCSVIEAWGLGYHLGNVVKYISRAEKKGAPLEDLKKARWYLDREIARREASRG